MYRARRGGDLDDEREGDGDFNIERDSGSNDGSDGNETKAASRDDNVDDSGEG